MDDFLDINFGINQKYGDTSPKRTEKNIGKHQKNEKFMYFSIFMKNQHEKSSENIS